MSISVPPPDYSFTGLIFNPDFWISPTDGLTQDVANALYLRKTVTDSASALETFNGGIRSTTYDVVGATTAKNYFSTQTTGGVELFKNMTAVATLKIGNPLVAQSNHVGNIDLQQNTINNASAPTSGVINIGNRQTTSAGLINIGTNTSRATTATIKIGHTTTDVQCSNLLLSSQSIDNATSVSNGALFIGFGQSASAGILYLGSALNRVGAINIGNGANVANTSAINLSSTASSGIINVNRPLTVNYNPSAITAGSTNLQIGNRFNPTLSSTTATFSATPLTLSNLCSFTLPIGVWIYATNFYINSTVDIARIEYSLSPTSLATETSTRGGGNNVGGLGQGSYLNGSGTILNATGAGQTWYLTGQCSVASVGVADILVNLTRIA